MKSPEELEEDALRLRRSTEALYSGFSDLHVRADRSLRTHLLGWLRRLVRWRTR
jgi:hypothetical protein